MPPLSSTSNIITADDERYSFDARPPMKALTDASSEPASPLRKRQRCKAVVTFLPVIRVADIPHKDDMTPDEKTRTWYSSSELYQIQKLTVSACQHGPQNVQCSRGLESATVKGSIRTRMARLKSTIVVLKGQKINTPTYDDKCFAVRKLYEDVSADSKSQALERARQDELEAQSYQSEYKERRVHGLGHGCWILDPSNWFPRTIRSPLDDLPSY